ncbi:leucine-rich repeat-containing protein 15 [Culex quinquefasciatus]|uniref:Leucine-rich repeat-containing protein 15 n=1 Tax=Culex quinquefasciatus TaxID=7176 RepID=B0WEF0_CULQU|nr:leucine-rich repeat-containing protein 15 [Culex quinquefasciatus]|eukprot:XP_001847084.1 leucine-rich repeat-containing protein 15 [Culex quinquefasciatus]
MAFNPIIALFLALATLTTISYAAEEFCPEECHCGFESGNFFVDCSGLALTELPHFPDVNVQILDLSDNGFTYVPSQLAQFSNLRYLDMSSNLIASLPPGSFSGLGSLKQLNLAKNNISSWANIYPNELLQTVPSLEELSLAENHFTSFSSNDPSLVLLSLSLKYLDLGNCKITKIVGKEVIQGLPALEHLKLNGNPMHGMSDIRSTSLKTLDLSNCKLVSLQPTVFSGLESLTYVNLARNSRLSLSSNGNVTSLSLKRINLSNCNMDSIDLGGFPNLMTAVLRGNMIRHLTRDSFAANPLLENIDISSNSIGLVQSDTFRQLEHLKSLDLSFNMIPRIDGKTFKENVMLTHINLSRNFIARLQRLVATSLAHLNVSSCEILNIDPDALGAMPALIDLDLSNNLLAEEPQNIASDSLQTLDLSMCRLTTIRNTTFIGLPNLLRINLSGNRFTTTFRVNNRKDLRCISPDDFFGATWEAACRSVWYPQDMMGTTERIWTYFMLAILAFFGFFCLYSSIRRFIDSRRKMTAERERQDNIQELREIARENQIRLRQQAQLNAPDMRESRPPATRSAAQADAASFASLDELVLRGKRRKKRKQRQSTGDVRADTEADDDQAELRPSNRSRSENVLSVRGTIYQEPSDTLNRESTAIYQSPRSSNRVVVASVHVSPSESRASQTVALQRSSTPTGEELHYHSTDILGIDRTSSSVSQQPSNRSVTVSVYEPGSSIQSTRNPDHLQNFNDRSYENSPYAKRKVKPLQHINPNGSIEEITDFEQHDTSPYAKRRIKHMASFKGGQDRPPLPARPAPKMPDAPSEIVVVEDYFKSDPQKELGQDDLELEFAVVTVEDVQRPLIVDEGEGQGNSSSDGSIEVIPMRPKPT